MIQSHHFNRYRKMADILLESGHSIKDYTENSRYDFSEINTPTKPLISSIKASWKHSATNRGSLVLQLQKFCNFSLPGELIIKIIYTFTLQDLKKSRYFFY